ncbi:MAG: tetratricopeptide repeat protein [Myxococcota bacterium]
MAAAAEPTAPAGASLWIVSARADLTLVIGAPLLIAPLMYLAAEISSPTLVAGFIFGVLSTGHHLPGFLRAYGDPALFARYRLRLLLMPPLVFGAIYWFTWNEMLGAAALISIWSIWHGLMQVYGFMRIYDAKRGGNSPLTRRLDWIVCAVSFVSILIWSDGASSWLLDPAEAAGLYFMPLLLGDAARTAAGVVASATACVYVAYTAWSLHRGRPVAPVKLLFLAVSVGFLYFSWVLAGGVVIFALATFEAFHDVQYLAIVWASNRRLVANGEASRMLRPLFRPAAGLAAVYVLLCLAYGGALNTQNYFASHVIVSLVVSLGLTSTLLHFYFDGFIWKVGQPKTRRDLEIPMAQVSANTAPNPATRPSREWPQFVYVGAPMALLAVIGWYRLDLEIPMREAIARIAPSSAAQHLKLGSAYHRQQRWTEAIAEYRTALAADPLLATAHFYLGTALGARGDVPDAMSAYRSALAADPGLEPSALALGDLLVRRNRPLEAAYMLRIALVNFDDATSQLTTRYGSDPDRAPKAAKARLMSALAEALLAAPPDADRTRSATKLASQAVANTRSREPKPLIALANVNAARQRWAVAIELLERALATPSARSNAKLSRRIEQSLAGFRARQAGDPRSRGRG